jgi:hypothetical protein
MAAPALRPYQNEAATHLYEHDRAMVLAPVGAGKTAATLTAMKEMLRDGHTKRFLVIAPLRVAATVWPTEAAIWAPELALRTACGSPGQRASALSSSAHVVVSNYDNLQWLAEQDLSSFTAIVFDELTRLKNPSGKRFKAFEKVVKDINVRWGLTGSFTSNGLEDVFGQVKIIDQGLLGRSKGAFMQQYFLLSTYGGYEEWTPRPGALEAVMERVKPATFLLQGSSSQQELHTVEVPVEMDMRDYETMRKNFVLQFPDAEAVAPNAATVTQKLQQLAAGFIYTGGGDAKWVSDHKLDAIADIWEENQRAPTIVWYQYVAEREALAKRFPQSLDVKTSGSIDAWNSGKVEMLLAHPASAGHGLNLQHGGHHMIWMSLPWSLELYEQAVGRLHRSGQAHDVWNYVVQTQGTVDEKILTALRDKRSLATIALESLK